MDSLQSDGYAAYNQFEKVKGITIAGCWAHARRKWVDEQGLTPEQRKELRQEQL